MEKIEKTTSVKTHTNHHIAHNSSAKAKANPELFKKVEEAPETAGTIAAAPVTETAGTIASADSQASSASGGNLSTVA